MNEIKFKDSFFDNPKSLEKLAESFWHSERLKYKASCSAIILSRWGQSTICNTRATLVKAYEGTRRKNNHKFRHIGVNTSQYRQSFFPKTIGAWNQLPYADSPTLESFRRNLLSTVRP